MNLLNVEWKNASSLDSSFRESLELFYKRMPQTRLDGDRWLADSNIDRLLNKVADEKSVDWCVVHGEGSLYLDQCKVVQLFEDLLFNFDEPILFVGQMINRQGQYCGIHEQLFAINMNIYRELGRPEFGNPNSGKKRLQKYTAGESLHDGYTPKVLIPEVGEDSFDTQVGGWNLVHSSMKNSLKGLNVPENIRAQKIFLYPQDHSEIFNSNLQAIFSVEPSPEIQQNRALLYLLAKKLGLENSSIKGLPFQLRERKKRFFLYNTELHLPQMNWIEVNKPKVKTLVVTAAGLLDIANVIGFIDGEEPFELIYYDVNSEALKYKKAFWEMMSGEDVDEITRVNKRYVEEVPNCFADFRRESENIESINYLLKEKRKNFTDVCNRIKSSQKRFVEVNLLNNPQKILSEIPSSDGDTFMLISDIFLGQNELVYGIENIRDKFLNFLRLAADKKNIIIQGKDLKDLFFINYAEEIDLKSFDSMMNSLNRL